MVKAASTEMHDYNQRINARVNTLMGQLQALTHGWQGPAGQAFLAAHNEWNTINAKHNVKLNLIGEALAQTAVNHQTMDQANADVNNKYHQALNV